LNTKFGYFYRDACNYKTYNEVVLEGKLEKIFLKQFLFEGTFFVPSEIGLPDLQSFPLKVYDHIWHEIDFCESTKEKPTVKISANELLKYFKISYGKNWNQGAVFKRKGMM
jgi:hypothetical protein